ncbi:twin transmembrane helix small protein [Crenalkalicoccus roseus]|uniref:twin transmembrane helix small protein n=1 Tax=Crenalkalicoccus roseus TaxID=1485588 RepID=UPI001081628A|nr:twin transmembrane helix small protein [Crenalkalicoccus roseus]
MRTLLIVLTAAAMLGVVGVLFAGLVGLVRTDANPHRSNVLMRWRVILQGVALALFILLLLLVRG